MTKHTYGTEVIEFFQHDDNELQEAIQRAEDTYYGAVKTPAETDKLAASIYFNCDLLAVAIPKIIELVQSGYTLRADRHIGMNGIALTCTLTLPQKQIEEDLIKVHTQATDKYEGDRLAKNLAEQDRQVNISLEKARRDAEKKAAAAELKAAEVAREKALSELRAAYAA